MESIIFNNEAGFNNATLAAFVETQECLTIEAWEMGTKTFVIMPFGCCLPPSKLEQIEMAFCLEDASNCTIKTINF